MTSNLNEGLKYTTVERIATIVRSKGQLHFGSSPHLGGQSVDVELFSMIAIQKEAFVDAVLQQIYELPLQRIQPIVSEIVEDLIVRDLLNTTPPQSTPAGGQTMPFVGGRAEFLLQMLTVGHNIAIPGVMPVNSMPGVATAQPILLMGERLRLNPPDTITQNVTVIGSRRYTVQNAYELTGIEWEGIGPSRAIGAERSAFR